MQRRSLLRLHHWLAMALVAPALAAVGAAHAQDLPKKTITMVVGFAPGGAADTAARIIGRKLADNTGLTVVIENKAGQAGTSPTSTPPTARPTAR